MPSAESKDSRGTFFHARFSDEARFLKAWAGNPGTTGAVSPSGKYLARMMARYVDPALPGPVIELGPGTGPVTQALIERGIAPERLILVEYDPAFCTLLQDRFPGATVIQGDAYDLPGTLAGRVGEPAAAIVSSLPLLNKQEADRIGMLKDAFALLGPGGNVVQFTYGMVSPIPRRARNAHPFVFNAEASPPVWLNIPPARVWIYKPAGDVVSLEEARGPFSISAERERLLKKLREHTFRFRDGFLEHRDRIERDLRLARESVRIDVELRAAHIRESNRLDVHFDRHLRPAISLIRRLGEGRRDPR